MSIGFWSVPEPWVRTPGGGGGTQYRNSGLNPLFELRELRFNLRFELCVRTLGSGNSMFEPWVRGTLNSMFEPRVRATLCSNPGFAELYIRTLGLGSSIFEPAVRGTLHLNPGFDELNIRTPVRGAPYLNPGFVEL